MKLQVRIAAVILLILASEAFLSNQDPWSEQMVGYPVVMVSTGQLRGALASVPGRSTMVRAFRSVPYAAAPVGVNRFRPPQPAASWSGIRDATFWNSKRCIRTTSGSNYMHGGVFSFEGAPTTWNETEDCLYLAVYAPADVTASELPVMLWITGGGFQGADPDVQSEDVFYTGLLADYVERQQPVIIVAVQYRINVFGFLGSAALRDRDPQGSTGNYGIQDQRACMKWVKNEISQFGGDPNRVMLFGQSAGAASISVHVAGQLSKGLFHSTVMMSGAFVSWSSKPMEQTEAVYAKILQLIGCANESDKQRCLEQVSADTLKAAAVQAIDVPTFGGPSCRGPAPPAACFFGSSYVEYPWSPSVDGVELTAHPWQLAESGHLGSKVPMIVGSVADEFAGNTVPADNWLSASAFNERMQVAYREVMGRQHVSAISAVYQNEPHNQGAHSPGWWSQVRAITDQSWGCAPGHAAYSLSGHDYTVYQYYFAHNSSFPPYQGRAQHGCDLPYVFGVIDGKVPPPLLQGNADEIDLSQQIRQYYYQMAASGNPNGNNTVHWRPFTPSSKDYLVLDTKIEFSSLGPGGTRLEGGGLRQAQCEFMNEWVSHMISAH